MNHGLSDGACAEQMLLKPLPDKRDSSAQANRRALLVAFHYPPWASSTGHLRTLAFAQYLPNFGWQPVVLTANPKAYEKCDQQVTDQLHTVAPVYRAFALDTRRHLGVRGKYLSLMAIPDRWVSWWPDAVRIGLRLIREQKIEVIWSTHPILTSHLIALSLSRLSGLPWVADFRDPVGIGGGALNKRVCRWLERQAIERSAHSVFTTAGARQLYETRFSESFSRKASVIANGYDEATFSRLGPPPLRSNGPVTLVHSGLLYREGRNPTAFLRALAGLKERGLVKPGALHVVLRASGNEHEYHEIVERLKLDDLVSFAGRIDYYAALKEQAGADGLLLFQGAEFNAQIPGKVYEYLRIGRPILAFTDRQGETASLLATVGNCTLASLTDEQEISSALVSFIARLKSGEIKAPDPLLVVRYSRHAGAGELARIFDRVVAEWPENRR